MLKHNFRIATRHLGKQKTLSFINISGLSMGLACFSLFLLYAVNEFSYDRNHVHADRIYRVNEWYSMQGRPAGGESTVSTPLGPALKRDFPDVEDYVRFHSAWGQKLVKTGDKVNSSKLSFADAQVLNVFSFPLVSGNAATALKDPSNIILTKDKALQLFGETNIVGRRVDIKMADKFEPFIVGGVAENIPLNSSIRFDILGNFAYLAETPDVKASMNDWHMTMGISTFVLLRPGSKLMEEPERLAAFRKKYFPDEGKELISNKAWDGKGALPVTYNMQPLRALHTDTHYDSEPGTTVDPKNIWILLGIAGAVLLIACINFTTLAIGRSAGRAKEVGVRKVLGSRRKQLIFQFLTESVLLSLLSAVLGLLLARLLLPYFNALSGKELSFSFAQYPEIKWLLLGTILITGLLAGSYPALALSLFKPVEVLKSNVRVGGSNIFTKSLVSLQFVISIGLILSTVIILQQLNFIRAKDLGFDKQNVVMLDASGVDAAKVYPLFRQALGSQPLIAGVSGSDIGLGEGAGEMGGYYEYKGKGNGAIQYPIDPDYLGVMNMKLLAGRNFDRSQALDTVSSVIVNQALVNEFGMTIDQALGKELKEGHGPGAPALSRVIIGVVKDFNFEPLTVKVRPQLFSYPSVAAPSKIFVRIQPGNPAAALDVLQKEWAVICPGMPFSYSFLDENLNRFYASETRLGGIFVWAGGVSIFLACMGLFGLAVLAATNRMKEIGIRKVLGASVPGIIGMLSKDFLKLVVISLVIASPLAWYFMHKWLQDYAYRIDISWAVFALTGAAAVLIALVTVAVQGVKAAGSNPVNSLRTE
jgi:putative ABC transport system permease protein